jgi:hypothetical protein
MYSHLTFWSIRHMSYVFALVLDRDFHFGFLPMSTAGMGLFAVFFLFHRFARPVSEMFQCLLLKSKSDQSHWSPCRTRPRPFAPGGSVEVSEPKGVPCVSKRSMPAMIEVHAADVVTSSRQCRMASSSACALYGFCKK